jgi:hypothetical protein
MVGRKKIEGRSTGSRHKIRNGKIRLRDKGVCRREDETNNVSRPN